ncbi:hypothetical protein D3C72_1758160 [compost metagenome]
MHFLYYRHGIAKLVHQLCGEFEAQIHLVGANVQQDIARGRNGNAVAGAYLTKRMKQRRAGLAEQPIPGRRAKSADAGQIARWGSFTDGTNYAADIRAPATHRSELRRVGG